MGTLIRLIHFLLNIIELCIAIKCIMNYSIFYICIVGAHPCIACTVVCLC